MQSKSLIPSVLFALLLVSALLGCGSDEETSVETLQPSLEPSTLTPQEIAEIALDSTVYLQVKKPENQVGSASGFVIGEGLIVTSYHVIEDMLTGSTARLVNSALIYPIEFIVAADKAHDLVILKSSGISAPALPLSDSDTVRIGDPVYVTGNPKGYLGTFSVGYISAVRFDNTFILIEDQVLQIAVSISKGSSGGPVLNANGKVIGIVSGGNTTGNDLNFAVPVNFLKLLLATIR